MSAQTISNAVAERKSGPITIMWDKRSHFNAVLPRSVDVEAFLGTAAGALYASEIPGKNITLMKCAQANPDSLIVALMECAALGHLPGTDEYYLTPRMDHGRPKVLGIEGYRGVIERMYRSGAVANVIVREVCENDYFDYREGEMDIPAHRFGGTGTTGGAFFGGMAKRGEMVGGYAYAKLTNGSYSRVVILTRDDVLAARDSGGYKPDDGFSPWNRLDGGQGHPEYKGRSMWWKTFAKRLEPWVPTSAEYRREQLRATSAAAMSGPRPVAELPAPPDDGIVDAEVVDEQPQPEPARLEQPQPRRQRPAAARAQQRRDAQDQAAEDVPWPDGAEPDHGRLADPRDEVIRLLDNLGICEYAAQGDVMTQLAGKAVSDADGLTADEAKAMAARLAPVKTRPQLDALLKTGEVPSGGE